MKIVYKDLFEYNHHMNQKVIQSFIQHNDKASEKSVKLINHLLNAHQIWNNRIDPKEDVSSVWQIHSLGKLKEMDTYNFERSLEILEKTKSDSELQYTNTKGLTFKNKVKDVLFHVINHSTYHRAQIASDFKESGITPEVTDYIVYKR
jgi:uncharacterized damage-inducible protein DinB